MAPRGAPPPPPASHNTLNVILSAGTDIIQPQPPLASSFRDTMPQLMAQSQQLTGDGVVVLLPQRGGVTISVKSKRLIPKSSISVRKSSIKIFDSFIFLLFIKIINLSTKGSDWWRVFCLVLIPEIVNYPLEREATLK